MPKRKARDLEGVEEPRRSSRRRSGKEEQEVQEPDAASKKSKAKVKKGGNNVANGEKVTNGVKADEMEKEDEKDDEPAKPLSKPKNTTKSDIKSTSTSTSPPGRQYWLMKAEPESRMERGHDVKFSIDDLAAKTEPEPWDGIRAYPARNNLRAMKKGDLAFFYHSNTKVPAIVGIMEIVEEHTPDLSAHNPSTPYYDPKSSPSSPKWSLVHVIFKQKLKTPVTLKELKEWFATKGNPLENMQMLKLARLSVSKIEKGEWEFLIKEMKERGDVVDL